jgi:hypothetical protein
LASLFHFRGGQEADVPACFHEQEFVPPYGDDGSTADKVLDIGEDFCGNEA